MNEAGEVTKRRTERTRETVLLNLQKTQPLKVKEILRYVTSEFVPAKEEMLEQSTFLEPRWKVSGASVGLESDQLKVGRVVTYMHRKRTVQHV